MTSVDIYGRRYNIGGEQEPETVQALAEYVDRRMRQMASQLEPGNDVDAAILAALNIADDYYRTRKALEQRQAEIDERCQSMSKRLLAALEPLNDVPGNPTE
ncbi:MAG: cell division protein ZapA [Acidobacteria bacterium]|nr:cell division protein ZapA [Acidobacteriota bacterium]